MFEEIVDWLIEALSLVIDAIFAVVRSTGYGILRLMRPAEHVEFRGWITGLVGLGFWIVVAGMFAVVNRQ